MRCIFQVAPFLFFILLPDSPQHRHGHRIVDIKTPNGWCLVGGGARRRNKTWNVTTPNSHPQARTGTNTGAITVATNASYTPMPPSLCCFQLLLLLHG
uniref:Putative secreted protein n=1 Tax=Anopheles triannulatus TaxID=58253 RepID=A0A2M4B6E6_9DIPT